jgi:hypothetical protein
LSVEQGPARSFFAHLPWRGLPALGVELVLDGAATQQLLHDHRLGLHGVAQELNQVGVVQVAAHLHLRHKIIGDQACLGGQRLPGLRRGRENNIMIRTAHQINGKVA